MKNRKILIICMSIILFISMTSSFCVNAGGLEQSVLDGMKGINSKDGVPTDSGIAKVINIVIGGLQYAGSGISLIVVAMLGIKYMLAGVEEKAEIKKQAIPIVIGCILLFGAVNLMSAIAKTAETVLVN